MSKSHYEILRVRESADRRAIRAAYLKKIKASHPDSGGGGKAARAAAVNLAYFVLRDARRRLAYDLELKRTRNGAGETGQAVSLWRPRALANPPRAQPPPHSRKAIASGLLVGAAILGLALLVVDLGFAARPPAPVPVAAADSAVPADPDANPWVDRAMVDRAVETLMLIRARGRSADAMAYSRNCFLELEQSPSALLLDHCLAFDVAAANWGPRADGAAEIDFAPQAMGPRHAAALRRLATAERRRERLREVNLATLAALARRLRPAGAEGDLGGARYADGIEGDETTR